MSTAQPADTWVFLRGLTREARHWGGFVQTFCQRLPDARVHAIDLPGNGRLNALVSPATVAEMVEFCRGEMARRAIAPPWRLLALSLGAMVAVEWAARHPREVRAAVLINTSLRPFSAFHERLRPRNYPALLKLALAGGSDFDRERSILRLTSNHTQPASLLEDWVAWRRERPVAGANALRQLLAAARYRAPATAPALPLLVLAGAADRLVDARCSRELARRWNCALAVHTSAGHDLPLDDGPWVAAEVARWLSAHARS